MKLKDCLEIGLGCDLLEVGEAMFNIRIHAPSLFAYDDVEKELKELDYEYTKYNCQNNDWIENKLDQLNRM